MEIHANSLFSKWFSESGKMVMKLFQNIWDIVENEDAFVCILIGRNKGTSGKGVDRVIL